MKKSKITKISLLVLSLALIVGAVCAVSASAEDTTPTPDIKNQNVYYTDAFHLMFAVDASTVSNGVKLYRYDEDPTGKTDVEYASEYTAELQAAGGEYGLPYDAYVFITDGVSATALDKVIYVQAEDGAGNKSAVKAYSVVEYLYTRLADVDGVANTDEQNGLYKSVIDFGTYAQKNFLKEAELAETTLISDYCYVSTEGCTVDGKTAAVLPQGKAFDVAGDNGALAKCTVTTYNTYDTTGTATNTVINGSSVTITDSARAHIVAGAAKVYREGTETFEGYTVGSTVTMSSNSANSLLYGDDSSIRSSTVATDTVFGTTSNVLPIYHTTGTIYVRPISEGTVAAADATSFEFSMDFKIDDSTLSDTQTQDLANRAWNNYTVCLKFKTASSEFGNVRISLLSESGNLQIDRNSDLARVEGITTSAREWNSLRFVVRNEGDVSYLDVYVNNDTDTPNGTLTGAAILPADITSVQMTRWNNEDRGATLYFDNIWCGYIAD